MSNEIFCSMCSYCGFRHLVSGGNIKQILFCRLHKCTKNTFDTCDKFSPSFDFLLDNGEVLVDG